MSDLPSDLLADMNQFCTCYDRFDYLRTWLNRFNINSSKIELKGKRHLLVRFKANYRLDIKTKTFVAHYDRVENTPGANDNSASVFQLLSLAARISKNDEHGNVQILFTDGEEINGGKISDQGSYQLAAVFKDRGITNCRFFVFDMCGIGDFIALGGAGNLLVNNAVQDGRISTQFYHEAKNEFKYFHNALAKFQGDDTLWLYSMFSDDLGFLLNHYPAVFFSTLPKAEAMLASSQWKEIMSDPNALIAFKKGYFSREFQAFIYKQLPNTWRTMHTPMDSLDKLELRAFVMMEAFLDFLTYKIS